MDAGGTEALHTRGGPASKKRHGAKSRGAGQRLDGERYGDFRLAAHSMEAGQWGDATCMWFASFAYVLLCALRRIALKHTQFAKANCATIRRKLLKIGALVRNSARRIKLAMASSFPTQREYRIAHARLAAAAR